MKATLYHLERRMRPFLIQKLPPGLAIRLYSKGREIRSILEEEMAETYAPPDGLGRELWGVKFRSPIMNAAGMFKNGESYRLAARQGAGGYLGGTTTWIPQKGYDKDGFGAPFVPYPSSHAASNRIGLRNEGDQAVSRRVAETERINGCPLGMSKAVSPGSEGEEGLRDYVKGMRLYEEAGIDFLELDESCPSTWDGRPQRGDLCRRLEYASRHFLENRSLKGRKRPIPVVVKLSNDTRILDVPYHMDMIFRLGYDGVNFGNSSADYAGLRHKIDRRELKLYDYFTGKFGGGVSGSPLNTISLLLGKAAADYVKAGGPDQEFHVFRTGGIGGCRDLKDSDDAGIDMNQWLTGFWERRDRDGNKVYVVLYEEYMGLEQQAKVGIISAASGL